MKKLLFILFTILAIRPTLAMDPAGTDRNGYSYLLTRAAACGKTRECKLLLDSYAPAIDWQDASGNSALHFAALEGHVEICELLINAGAVLNTVNKNYRTPLHCATQLAPLLTKESARNKARIYELLIDHGADIKPKDATGWAAPQLVFHNGLHKELLANRIKTLLLCLNQLRTSGDQCARLLYREFRSLLLPKILAEDNEKKTVELDAYEAVEAVRRAIAQRRGHNNIIAFA